VVDNHKAGDFKPYLLKSTDRGKSWTSIVGNLPERHVLWRLVQDHERADLLFLGTEFGVFFTVDGGERWTKLSGGAPNVPFRDLAIQTRENDLVGATFGRSFYVFDDYTPLRHVSDEMLAQEAELFPVRKTWWYMPRSPLGRRGKASQGTGFFVAPNPPFGAVFTYYLRDEIQTLKKQRRKREKEIEKEDGDTPYPGWDEIRREREEEDPVILLTVRDESGAVVRRLSGPVEKGFHRVAWDLRYPSTAPWKPARDDDEFNRNRSSGAWAPPGSYTVSLAKRIGGEVTDLGKTQTFEVVRMREGTLPGATPAETVAFMKQLSELRGATDAARASIDEAVKRLDAIAEVLDRSTVEGNELGDATRELKTKLRDVRLLLAGDQQRRGMGDPGPVSISRRLEVAGMGTRTSTYGPTPTHRRSYEIAEEQFEEIRGEIERVIRVELPALEKLLDDAGVPWTPGR